MNLTTVLYGFAFSLTCLLLPKKMNLFSSNSNKFLLLLTFVLSFIFIIISGRRAFWVICIICPLIIITIFKFSNVKIKLTKYLMPLIYGAFLIVGIFTILSLDLLSFKKEFNTIFEFDSDINYLRKEQFGSLITGWKELSIFGNGLGAAAKGSI